MEHRKLSKTRKMKVTTSRRNTTNFYQHIKQHKEKYEKYTTVKVLTSKDTADSQSVKQTKYNKYNKIRMCLHRDRKKSLTT